jgi:hypothetical protein
LIDSLRSASPEIDVASIARDAPAMVHCRIGFPERELSQSPGSRSAPWVHPEKLIYPNGVASTARTASTARATFDLTLSVYRAKKCSIPGCASATLGLEMQPLSGHQTQGCRRLSGEGEPARARIRQLQYLRAGFKESLVRLHALIGGLEVWGRARKDRLKPGLQRKPTPNPTVEKALGYLAAVKPRSRVRLGCRERTGGRRQSGRWGAWCRPPWVSASQSIATRKLISPAFKLWSTIPAIARRSCAKPISSATLPSTFLGFDVSARPNSIAFKRHGVGIA